MTALHQCAIEARVTFESYLFAEEMPTGVLVVHITCVLTCRSLQRHVERLPAEAGDLRVVM